jgi:hypothetical protein
MLKRLVSRALGGEISLQPLGRHQQPLRTRPHHRVGMLPAMLLELTLRVTQPPLATLNPSHDPLRVKLKLRVGRRLNLSLPGWILTLPLAGELAPGLAEELAPALRRAQLLGQLITTRVAEQLVLGLIRRPDQLDDLLSDPAELRAADPAGVTRQPSAIDRDHPRLHQPGLITQPQHLAKQISQRALVTNNEPRDRRMIKHNIASNHPVGHILAAMTLDRPR